MVEVAGITPAVLAGAPSGPSPLRGDVQIRSRRICEPAPQVQLPNTLKPKTEGATRAPSVFRWWGGVTLKDCSTN
jgi:hypothetical protein